MAPMLPILLFLNFAVERADGFGGILKPWVPFIHNHLGDQGDNITMNPGVFQLVEQCLLDHVPDLALSHRVANIEGLWRDFSCTLLLLNE